MRKICLALLVVCSIAAGASPLAPEVEKKIDEVFAEWSGTRTPGCAVGIMDGRELVFTRGYGMASLEHGIAITPETVFPIQSTSKQFIAIAIVLLIQDGKLSFDDDVRKYVPELPDYGAKITVRHLLEHSSGLRDINILAQDKGWGNEESHPRAQLIRLITRQKSLNHPPGAAASYSNSGYLLLMLIAERITGERFGALLARRVFEPLGMTSSRYREDAGAVIEGRAEGYSRRDGTWRRSPGGNNTVFTTIGDLARWMNNFTRPVVGGEEGIRWMTTWGKLDTGQTTEWGLGLSPLRYRGLEGFYFSGGSPEGTSVLVRFPEQDFSLLALCNGGLTFNAEPLAQKVIDAALAGPIATASAKPLAAPPSDPAAVAVSRAELQRHAGLYFSSQSGPWTREFREADGKLRVVLPDRAVDLIHVGGGRFRAPGSSTEYVFNGNTARRVSPTEPDYVFERVDETKNASLSELAGTYWNDEIEADVVFKVIDGKLHYELPLQASLTALEPKFRDAFADGPLWFRFVRDRRGRITGVTKHWDRVWTLTFTRR